ISFYGLHSFIINIIKISLFTNLNLTPKLFPFQHARYPSIHNLSTGKSIPISNVSAVFKGTINYRYGSWLGGNDCNILCCHRNMQIHFFPVEAHKLSFQTAPVCLWECDDCLLSLQWLFSEGQMLKVRSVSVRHLWTTTEGTSVRAVAGVELLLDSQDKPALYLGTISTNNTFSIVLVGCGSCCKCLICREETNSEALCKAEAVEKMGIHQSIILHFEWLHCCFISIIVHVQGYVIVQLDFSFLQHLLVEFPRRTLN
uniref:Uncharacterized protein n=1 Tax=Cyprinus carpio carpio TaxID=630221 RepID=A0A9J7XBZ5_CYPCA